MIPELGYGATAAALALAVWGAGAAAGAARTGRADLLRSGERAAVGVWVLITACIALMLYAFLTFDFSVRYVAFPMIALTGLWMWKGHVVSRMFSK